MIKLKFLNQIPFWNQCRVHVRNKFETSEWSVSILLIFRIIAVADGSRSIFAFGLACSEWLILWRKLICVVVFNFSWIKFKSWKVSLMAEFYQSQSWYSLRNFAWFLKKLPQRLLTSFWKQFHVLVVVVVLSRSIRFCRVNSCWRVSKYFGCSAAKWCRWTSFCVLEICLEAAK